jgi:hypothetical protein
MDSLRLNLSSLNIETSLSQIFIDAFHIISDANENHEMNDVKELYQLFSNVDSIVDKIASHSRRVIHEDRLAHQVSQQNLTNLLSFLYSCLLFISPSSFLSCKPTSYFKIAFILIISNLLKY